tara:strand:+ start:136 stop:648 length:513 start_codon:yes stop_codon:yes gene_type:complete
MILGNISIPPGLQIFNNQVLVWALIACGLAQISKLFVELIVYQKWRPSVLLETGGMPSSHSALVTGAASGVGQKIGFDSPEFAIAATLALVVMYDASGIRRAAGVIASRVNELPNNSWNSQPDSPLKEKLGHSRLEVFVGSIIGPAIALPGIIFIGSPLNLFYNLFNNLG